MYVPYAQTPLGGMAFEIRTAGDPASAVGAIREAVRQVDPNVPLMNVSTQMEQIEAPFRSGTLFAQAYALFGGLALLVASIGLFGVMSYSVARRTNEIGIRMALGAQRRDVVRMVMRESTLLVAAGVVIGVGAALASSRLVASLLFGLRPDRRADDRARRCRPARRVDARRLSARATGGAGRPDGGAPGGVVICRSRFQVLAARFVFRFGSGFGVRRSGVRCSGSGFDVLHGITRGTANPEPKIPNPEPRTRNSEGRTEPEHEPRTEHREA